MLKYELTIRYHWDHYGDSGHGKPVPIAVYASNHDEAVQKAVAQGGTEGLKPGGWHFDSVVSVEELPEMINPAALIAKDQYIDTLQAEIAGLKDTIDSLRRAPQSFDLPDPTRVAVVSQKDVEFQTHGGMYEHGAWVSIQDDGKTLKLFPLYKGGHHRLKDDRNS